MARTVEAVGFSPAARPRLVIAGDGTLAAIQEPSRIVVVEVPSCVPFAELGMDTSATGGADVAWVGTPPRLIVLSRFAGHSTVHLVDPFGPRTIAEMRMEAPMKLCAAVGSHALVIGTLGAAILAATDTALGLFQFPARARPVTAGAAGSQFMVALGSAIEEWDPQTRMPKRRLKLARPAVITAVGGSDRVVWMTTQDAPDRIEVIPLVDRGQPKLHELPEPIATVASHPRSDLIACVGAKSGRIWVIDLDGRSGLRMIGPEGIDRAEAASIVIGRVTGVLAAQTNRPIKLIPLDAGAHAPVAPASHDTEPSLGRHRDTDSVEEVLTSVTLASPPESPSESRAESRPESPRESRAESRPESPRESRAGSRPESPRESRAESRPESPPMPARRAGAKATADAAIDTWRERAGAKATADAAIDTWRERAENSRARTSEPVPPLWDDALPMWREEAVAWAQSNAHGAPPASTPFGAMIARFELSPQLQPVLALLYGAHLSGQDGVAPADVARVLGGRWDEALGRGELALRGVADVRGSRVRLASQVMRALDEMPPLTGTLVGTPGQVSLLGPCVIVAAGPLPIVAEACVSSIGGAILAGHADADPPQLVREARAYGAAPMLRVTPRGLERVPTDEPIILVVEDDVAADGLGIPRLT